MKVHELNICVANPDEIFFVFDGYKEGGYKEQDN